MHFKGFYLMPIILCLASVASAQEEFTGSLGATGTGNFTDSSLTLDATNISGGATETFDLVPLGTDVTAYSTTIADLSSTLESLAISDFLEIGTAGEFGSPGTSPPNRFDFNLQSLEESDPTLGQFIGYGTLVDTQAGGYAGTPAELDITFSDANTYAFTLTAVPEPATLTLLLAGVGMLPFLRRKF